MEIEPQCYKATNWLLQRQVQRFMYTSLGMYRYVYACIYELETLYWYSGSGLSATVRDISSVDHAHCCCHGAGCQCSSVLVAFVTSCLLLLLCCRSPFTLISFKIYRHYAICHGAVRGRLIHERNHFQQHPPPLRPPNQPTEPSLAQCKRRDGNMNCNSL